MFAAKLYHDVKSLLPLINLADGLAPDCRVNELGYVFHADVIAGAKQPVWLDDELRLRAFLLDTDIHGTGYAAEQIASAAQLQVKLELAIHRSSLRSRATPEWAQSPAG